MFGFQQDCMIVSYCPKENKIFNILSTLHSEPKVDTSNEQRKPEVILTYNETKAGLDTMDQMTRTYSCKRKTRRWPLVVFYNVLDISAINAYVIWKALNPNWNSNKSHKRRLSPPFRKGTSRSKWRANPKSKRQLIKQEKLPLNHQEKRRDALFAPPQRIEKWRQSVQSVLKMSANNTALLCV